MRVLLVHNPGAGAGPSTAGDELLDLARAQGHLAEHLSTGEDGWTDRMRDAEVDVVAIAGGDGTLRKAMTALAGTDVTVGVIATGTANNIANTLGTPIDDPAAAIAAWDGARELRYDVPLLRSCRAGGEVGSSRLVESVGGGTFAELLAVAEDQEERLGQDGDLQDGLRLLRGVLRDADPEPWRVVLDGEDLSGSFVAVEAMNIRRVGPNVELAPGARPGDGSIDLVLVDAHGRDALVRHVDDLAARGTDRAPAPLGLRVRRGAELRLVPPSGSHLHVDDQHWRADVAADGTSGDELELVVDGTTLRVLVPPR